MATTISSRTESTLVRGETIQGNRSKLSLSVIIPVHNEALTIMGVLTDLKEAFADLGSELEVIVVDDASTDDSGLAVRKAGSFVTLIRNPRRLGSGRARRIGSEVASGEYVAWIDGDGTYAVADLLKLFDGIGDADQVVGARRSDFGPLRLLRVSIKCFNNLLASLLWGRRIKDLNSGLRIFRREALMDVLPELPSGFSCTSTATLAGLNRGQRLVELPISYKPRLRGGKSKFHPITDTWRLWRVVFVQCLKRWRSRSA